MLKLFLVSNWDLVNSNSGNTLDRKLNCLIKFYSTTQNETVWIDYGDNKTEKINISGG